MIFCSSTDFSVKPWSITIFSALVQGYPDKYYLYFIHRDTYPYKYLASNFYAYQFMYTFKVFDHTLIVETIIYMYLLCFCPYINCCNHTKYLFSRSIVVDYYIQFSVIFINIAYVRCNQTKPASRGLACGCMITATSTIIAKTCPNFHHTKITGILESVIHDARRSKSRISVS